jgi:hypothetical protein
MRAIKYNNIIYINVIKMFSRPTTSHHNRIGAPVRVVRSSEKPAYLEDRTKTVTFDDFFKIVVIMDESGSMMPIRDQIIEAINNLVLEQKKIKETPSTFTMVKFNEKTHRVITNRLLTNVNILTTNDYKPSGQTALYDAIKETVEWFKNEKNVLMVIVTDGDDNVSKCTKHEVNQMIDRMKNNNGWTYVYLSSDLGTEQQGNTLGLQKSNFSSNCRVAQNQYGNFISGSLNKAIGNYRNKGVSVQSQLN